MSDNITDANAAAGDQIPLPERPRFPEGLRVLTVDDDPSCLRTISLMLQQCKFQVTSVTNAFEALELLRKNRESYDLVLTDVRMPDMDGFELLKIISIEMDVPVIMMSVDDSAENVLEGVKHGARDYLVKPVRLMELKNIWQHLMRKTELNLGKLSLMNQEIVVENLPLKKRRGKDKVKEEVNDLPDGGIPLRPASSVKKRRFAWTEAIHLKFVEAVNLLDPDKAVPKQIVELMNEPELTREIVASHLQKYRNYLRKSPAERLIYDAGQRGIPEAFLNPTPTSYSLTISKEENNGSSSGSGFMSFREHMPQPDMLSNSRLNEKIMIGNQLNLWSRQNYNSPQMSNQAPTPISVNGNMPLAQSLVENPSGRGMIGDYVDLSSQIPNFGSVQPGPPLGFTNFAGQSAHSGYPLSTLPLTEHASHPFPSGVLSSFGSTYQMLDRAPIQTSQSFQRQHGGRVAPTAFNGGVGSDRRGYPVDFQATDKSRANGQGAYMQLLTGKMENNHHNSLSSIDDDLPTEEEQDGPTSDPMN